MLQLLFGAEEGYKNAGTWQQEDHGEYEVPDTVSIQFQGAAILAVAGVSR